MKDLTWELEQEAALEVLSFLFFVSSSSIPSFLPLSLPSFLFLLHSLEFGFKKKLKGL
jgi:hypothetical protein